MSTLIGIRGEDANSIDALYSPAKEKAANRGAYSSRSPLLLRRARQLLGEAKLKVFLGFFALCVLVFVTSRLSSFMGWNPHYPSSVSSPSRYLFFSLLYFVCNVRFCGCDLFYLYCFGFVGNLPNGVSNWILILLLFKLTSFFKILIWDTSFEMTNLLLKLNCYACSLINKIYVGFVIHNNASKNRIRKKKLGSNH